MNPLVAMALMAGKRSYDIGEEAINNQRMASNADTNMQLQKSMAQKNRMIAQQQIGSEGSTGFQGIDAINPAMQRQQQIFKGILSKYNIGNMNQYTSGGNV